MFPVQRFQKKKKSAKKCQSCFSYNPELDCFVFVLDFNKYSVKWKYAIFPKLQHNKFCIPHPAPTKIIIIIINRVSFKSQLYQSFKP